MGKYRIEIERQAKKGLDNHYKSGNKSTRAKLEMIFIELAEHPYSGLGNPEALRYELSGYWSRRITAKDRLIYTVEEYVVTVYVISAMGHYGQK